jgi:hypothetical protein
MFDSARSILDKYIDTSKLSRFTFYSVEMERGENPEDLYYLCSVKDHFYVIFETDYIMNSLADVAKEAADIYKGYELEPLCWITKKDAHLSVDESTISINVDNIDKHRDDLVSDRAGSAFGYAVRYAVIEFADIKDRRRLRFDPNTYGKVS